MPLGKLLKTDRTINVYKKSKSKFQGNPISEIDINSIPLAVLRSIITSNNDDPMLYDGYILTPEELEKINGLMNVKIIPNHKKLEYVLEAYGIYEK